MGGSGPSSIDGKNDFSPIDEGDGGQVECPKRLKAVVMGPAQGIVTGARLEVGLDKTSTPPRVILVDLTSNSTVGSIAGIPELDSLLDCLERGVTYRAFVDRVDGGRVDVTITQL